MHKFDPINHAFIRPDRETALARAHRLDAMRWAGEVLGPLHGVRLAPKDMYCRVAQFSGRGSRIRSKEPAKITTTVLRKLDGAGAVDACTNSLQTGPGYLKRCWRRLATAAELLQIL